MFNKDETSADKVLNYLTKMTSISGYVNNPIALGHFVSEELEKRKIEANNAPETARNVAYLYACLCNEYMLAANSELTQRTDEFYVTEWKWGKYRIGRKIRETRLPLLSELGWIEYRYGYYHGNRNLYKINIDKLRRMSERAKNFGSEKKLNAWLENFFADKRKDETTCKAVDKQITAYLKNNENGGLI